MKGLFVKKYHVAVLDKDDGFITKMVELLKEWYDDRIVIEVYSNSKDMFEAVNINRVKNKPFDLAVLSPSEVAEKMVLKHVNPSLKIVMCSDEQAFQMEAKKVLL